MAAQTDLANHPAPSAPYFTPLQDPAAGTLLLKNESDKVPKLFQPIKLRGLTLQNRIILSPLCQYSSQDGHFTPWQETHIGGIVQRGPGLSCIEATAVTANGRITPEDSGLWKDSQIEPLKKVIDFAHSQNQKIMIQIAHAGRKASTVAPWISRGDTATPELNGWPDDVWGPSAIPYNEHHAPTKEMSLAQIDELKEAWAATVKRSLKAGFDAIEIHNAHGYLLHEFLSPVTNQRSDKYGGSFENRTRLTLEIVELTRALMPKDMPLFLRLSATDWLETHATIKESWTLADSVRLAPLLAERGVDVLDVSSGGQHPEADMASAAAGGIDAIPQKAYQSAFAVKIKEAVGDKLVVGTVGGIDNGVLANDLLELKGLDLIFCGRHFQKNPGLVFKFADDLGVTVAMANQTRWAFGSRRGLTPVTALWRKQGKL